jgi:hypothetical protein
MWFLLLMLSVSAFAQNEDIDLDILKKLDQNMPDYQPERNVYKAPEGVQGTRKYIYPNYHVTMPQLLASGVITGAVKKGARVIDMNDGTVYKAQRSFLVKFYRIEDEFGYRYLQAKGRPAYKVKGTSLEETSLETNLYEPPDQYTPAPTNKIVSDYNPKLRFLPEPVFYSGFVDGSYMKDLFNDRRARYGTTTQFGIQAMAKWNWPIKIGGAFHYERSTYLLHNDGRIIYTSPSIGPIFKTKDFVVLDFPFRFQMQYRLSPFARTDVHTRGGDLTLKFNSSDLAFAFEHPEKNRWGEFVLGLFFQAQWLDLRHQTTAVNVIANNQTNNSFGVSFSQVFE